MSRSKWKIPFIDPSLINKKSQKIKIFSRQSTIYPFFLHKTVLIHNGKSMIKTKITDNMLGQKFGEFVKTKQSHVFKKNKCIK